jgi:DNA-binding response OmpR family regulator
MATKPCRVLVVDDDRDTAETLAYLLVGMGYEATFLTEPSLVAETVDRIKPHIVFLDIGMPGLNGWEIAATIRKKYPYDGLHLVAITALGDDQARIKSRQAGFDAHVHKPVAIELVESIIKQLVAR